MSAEGFSAAWLRQREPFDAAARARAADTLALDTHLAALRPPPGVPWRVIDLGCGTGANLRWLAPRLGGAQQWLAVDHDAALLRRWPSGLSGPGFDAATVCRRLDLSHRLQALPWAAAHLVTASALLDLVSESWLQQLVRQATATRAALLFSLSVDGRHTWAQPDALDGVVENLFQQHQRRDKGFGPALGPKAVPALRRALGGGGYRVFSARSDWHIDPQGGAPAVEMQRALIEGMARAAIEQAPGETHALDGWRQRRLALAEHSALRVGHLDVLAIPA